MKNTHIVENDWLLRKIVRCVTKALGEDINTYKLEHRLETNNNLFMHRGDYINQNLRTLVAKDNLILIPFKRFVWEGRVLLDKGSKITYTILSNSALESVRKNKARHSPHYLHSILFGENAEFEGIPKQMTLTGFDAFGPSCFDNDDLKKDYNGIMGENTDISKECTHYIVSYSAEHGQVQNVELLLLDKELCVVETVSLNKYLVPDFADLTANLNNNDEAKMENVRELVNIKPGIATKIRKDEKKA